MLISKAFADYREYEIIMGGQSKKTAESYFYCCKLLTKYFGDDSVIEDLTLEKVRDWHANLLTWQRPDSARLNLVCLRCVLKRCRRDNLNVLDPGNIRVPKREKRKISYLTFDEVEKFISVVAQKRRGYCENNRLRNIAIMKVIRDSGLRVSELCQLNRNTIKNLQFTVVGKSRDPRIVFITMDAWSSIETYLARRSDRNHALFIANQTGNRITPDNVRKVFNNACNNSEFDDVHPHTIRHSFGTYMLSKGVDLRYIGDLMGHQSLDTTRIYTHYENPRLRDVYFAAHG